MIPFSVEYSPLTLIPLSQWSLSYSMLLKLRLNEVLEENATSCRSYQPEIIVSDKSYQLQLTDNLTMIAVI